MPLSSYFHSHSQHPGLAFTWLIRTSLTSLVVFFLLVDPLCGPLSLFLLQGAPLGAEPAGLTCLGAMYFQFRFGSLRAPALPKAPNPALNRLSRSHVGQAHSVHSLGSAPTCHFPRQWGLQSPFHHPLSSSLFLSFPASNKSQNHFWKGCFKPWLSS